MAAVQVLLYLLAYAATEGSAQITCYTVSSVDGEFNCEPTTDNFQAGTIEECCVENIGHFFEEGEDNACQACIVFGFFNGSEITLPEQGEAITLAIGFIKGGIVQQLTSIDSRNTARFSFAIGGNATQGPNADFTIQPTAFEIFGPDAREPFELSIFVRVDGVALEPAEEITLTLEGLNSAGRAIIVRDPALPGQFVDPVIHVVIEDIEEAILQFTERDYSNSEGELFIEPVVQLLTVIATDLRVQIVPVNITEALARDLPSDLLFIPPFNPRRPNIATSVADFSTEPVEITFPAGGAFIRPGIIQIVDDDINEVDQNFALFLEVVDTIDPGRVDLQSGRFASLARIFDNDPINIGFEQERYTVYEAFNATGELIPIPIIKENGQESELTFEVIATLTLGSGPTAAQPGEDFDANPPVQRQDFDPDEQEIYFRFELFDDTPDVPEPTETFQIEISLFNMAAIGGSLFDTATIVIIDDDDVIIGFEQNVTRVNESQSILELCVRVLNLKDTQEIQDGFEVSLAANSIQGTAADPTDYVALQAEFDLFFDIIDGAIRRTCIEIEIINDGLLEGVEFFSIEVVPDPFVTTFPSNVQLGPNSIIVEILDDDSVTIGFNPTEYTVLEPDRFVTVFVAVLEGSLQRRVSVSVSTNANTTTAGVETTKVLLFDESTSEVQVNISIIDNNIFEELLETFTVSLVGDPADSVIVNPKTATVSIRDAAVINFSSPVYSVREAETNVTVQLLLSFDEGFNLSSQSIEVEFMTVNVTAQGGRDYEVVFTNITINSTVTSISIPIFNDQAVEANETFRCSITLISPTSKVVITQTEAVVVIVDDDNVIVQFKEPEYSVMEGRQLSLGVQIMGENEIPLTVPFTIRGTATREDNNRLFSFDWKGQDDFNLTSGKDLCITIDPNVAIDPITTRCLLLNLSIVDDDIALEGTESIQFELSDEESQVRLGEQSSTTVLITDDDEIGVSFVDVPCEGSENENLTVSVSRSGARIASNLTLNVTVELLSEMNVTGCGTRRSDDTDFTNLKIAVTFNRSDMTEDTSSFYLPIVDDDMNEPEEIFFLSLRREANPTPGVTLPNRMMACTLQDDDEISIHFGEENYTFQESVGPHVISLNATRSSQQEFLLAIEPEVDGNSIFTVTNAELISFQPQQGSNSSMTISIDVVNDNARGRNQSKVLRLQRRLQSPSFANCIGILQTCSSTTIHITDDDRVIIGFESSSRRVLLESVGEIQLCVSVMFNSIGNDFESFPLKVDTSAHSAKPGRDYIIDPSNDCLDNSSDSGNNNSFRLGPFNHTSQRCCWNVKIVDDGNQEEELVIEFNVSLSQADVSRLLPIDIDPDVITVVIVDDDQCAIEATELEDAFVCYNQSSNCSGSCIILNITDECCSINGTSVGLLGNDTCLDTMEICASPSPSQTTTSTTNPPSSSNQSIVIIASVMASVGFILLVIVAFLTILIVCLRRAQKTNNFDRKGKVDTPTTGHHSTYEGMQSVVSAEFIQTLPKNLIIYASQLNLKDLLGNGEFGVVYKAFFKRNMNSETEVVAVKTLKGLFTSKDVHSLVEEVLKMQGFHHLHVMSLVGVCLDSGAGPAIVMPYMANGSLLDYLRKERDSLLLTGDACPNKVSETQKFLLNVCLQIAEGMEYLAQEKVIHRDLSARNCMIDADGTIKVADFGLSVDVYLANYYRQGKEQEEMKLPIRWMAVESIMDGIYTKKSDVWSFGVTMWEVYSGGKLPYPGVASPALIQRVASGERPSKPENAACSDEVYYCMQQCWVADPDRRPHFRDLVSTISNMLESHHETSTASASNIQVQRTDSPNHQSCEKHGGRYDQIQTYKETGGTGVYDPIQGYEKASRYDQIQSYEESGVTGVYDPIQGYEKASRYDQIQSYEKTGGGRTATSRL